jgi:hypothetical protein
LDGADDGVTGINVSSVQRIWRSHGLQPHRMRQFKLSNDTRFAGKTSETRGLAARNALKAREKLRRELALAPG